MSSRKRSGGRKSAPLLWLSAGLLMAVIEPQAGAQLDRIRDQQQKAVEAAGQKVATAAALKSMRAEDELWRGRREGAAKAVRVAQKSDDPKAAKEAGKRLAEIDANHKLRLDAIKAEHGDAAFKSAVAKLQEARSQASLDAEDATAMKGNPAWKAVKAEEELWKGRRESVAQAVRDAGKAEDKKALREAEARLTELDANHKARLQAIKSESDSEHYQAAVERLRVRRQRLKEARSVARQAEEAAEAGAAKAGNEAALEKAALEKAALEKAALEKAAVEKAAVEMTVLEKAAHEKAAHEKAEQVGVHQIELEQKAVEKELEHSRRQHDSEVAAAGKVLEEEISQAKRATAGDARKFEELKAKASKKHHEKLEALHRKQSERKSKLGRKLDELRARGRKAKEAGVHPGRGGPVKDGPPGKSGGKGPPKKGGKKDGGR